MGEATTAFAFSHDASGRRAQRRCGVMAWMAGSSPAMTVVGKADGKATPPRAFGPTLPLKGRVDGASVGVDRVGVVPPEPAKSRNLAMDMARRSCLLLLEVPGSAARPRNDKEAVVVTRDD